ncbi:hypothetical protein, partial [Klebsiella variicola]|uniref:hypothetical protein n=1 Tax=Klebsiella variicola TaxID=244366 RepID=UPI002B05F7EB
AMADALNSVPLTSRTASDFMVLRIIVPFFIFMMNITCPSVYLNSDIKKTRPAAREIADKAG